MLIQAAEIAAGQLADVRLDGPRIAAIAPHLTPDPGEECIDAAGGALLPGLHDHHIHLFSAAASIDSIACGPPLTEPELGERLRQAAAGATGWLRGVGYHPSVAGEIDRDWLDRQIPDLPIRIQHRSGRLWVCNSAALAILLKGDPGTGLERAGGRCTGRLYDGDAWLRTRLRSIPPSLAKISAQLAARGIVGVTDATASNGAAECEAFASARQSGELRQRVWAMGNAKLIASPAPPPVPLLALKIHLHDTNLPDPEAFLAEVAVARSAGVGVAVHCVTAADLAYTVGLLEQAGASALDRIEHASITPPDMLPRLAALGVSVVTQPHFMVERGDQYRRDVTPTEQAWLYRCNSFLATGIPLGGGSDAPFGGIDPWAAMQAAVDLRKGEAVSPEQALALFAAPPDNPGGPPRRVAEGESADLCLLHQSWKAARTSLAGVVVSATFIQGLKY